MGARYLKFRMFLSQIRGDSGYRHMNIYKYLGIWPTTLQVGKCNSGRPWRLIKQKHCPTYWFWCAKKKQF